MWQHVKLSVQIRPLDTLACYWDVKQPTNKPTRRGSHGSSGRTRLEKAELGYRAPDYGVDELGIGNFKVANNASFPL